MSSARNLSVVAFVERLCDAALPPAGIEEARRRIADAVARGLGYASLAAVPAGDRMPGRSSLDLAAMAGFLAGDGVRDPAMLAEMLRDCGGELLDGGDGSATALAWVSIAEGCGRLAAGDASAAAVAFCAAICGGPQGLSRRAFALLEGVEHLSYEAAYHTAVMRADGYGGESARDAGIACLLSLVGVTRDYGPNVHAVLGETFVAAGRREEASAHMAMAVFEGEHELANDAGILFDPRVDPAPWADAGKAMRCYRVGADHGQPDCMVNLATLMPSDRRVEAIALMRRAEAMGDRRARALSAAAARLAAGRRLARRDPAATDPALPGAVALFRAAS